jgi:thymidine phosphorylase
MANEETNTPNVAVLSKEDWQGSPEVLSSLSGIRLEPDEMAVVAFHRKEGISDCEVCITCRRKAEDGTVVPFVIVLSWGKAMGLAAGLVDVLDSLNEFENNVTNEEAAEASDSESTPPSEEGQANHE